MDGVSRSSGSTGPAFGRSIASYSKGEVKAFLAELVWDGQPISALKADWHKLAPPAESDVLDAVFRAAGKEAKRLAKASGYKKPAPEHEALALAAELEDFLTGDSQTFAASLGYYPELKNLHGQLLSWAHTTALRKASEGLELHADAAAHPKDKALRKAAKKLPDETTLAATIQDHIKWLGKAAKGKLEDLSRSLKSSTQAQAKNAIADMQLQAVADRTSLHSALSHAARELEADDFRRYFAKVGAASDKKGASRIAKLALETLEHADVIDLIREEARKEVGAGGETVKTLYRGESWAAVLVRTEAAEMGEELEELADAVENCTDEQELLQAYLTFADDNFDRYFREMVGVLIEVAREQYPDEDPSDVASRVIVSTCFLKLICGQVSNLKDERRTDVTREELDAATDPKTGKTDDRVKFVHGVFVTNRDLQRRLNAQGLTAVADKLGVEPDLSVFYAHPKRRAGTDRGDDTFEH